MPNELQPPDLSDVPVDDLCILLLTCGASTDPSDKMFAKTCRDEIAKRKPESPSQKNA